VQSTGNEGAGAEQRLHSLAKTVSTRDGVTVYTVEPSRLREAVLAAKQAGYEYLLSITGIDEPKEKRIRVLYHLADPANPMRVVAIETSTPRDSPRLPSIHDLIPAAQIQERETHEMLGVVFEGNPDQRHLLLPDDWPPNTYPLRKDFRIPDEPFMSRKPSKPLEELKKQTQQTPTDTDQANKNTQTT